jgi:fibronectin type 3 domain-containing protein
VDYVHVYNYVVSSVPDAPTGLTATPGGTQVVLGWSPSNGATNYNVKFSTTNGGPYTTIGSTATTGYTNTGLANGTTYYYVVSAVNSFGESSNSVQISATTTVPSANLALHKVVTVSSVENAGLGGANAVDGNTTSTRWSSAFSDPQWIYVDLQATININRVRFYWENSYATSFQIQVSSDATNWTSIYSTTTGPGGVQNLTGLSGTGRYVRMYGTVRKTQYGYSLWEFEVYGNIFVPTNLTATAGNQQVSLSWNAVPGATSYNVKSSTTNGGPYVTIASPTTTGYTNTGLVNGTTCYYVVSQVNPVAESTNSTQVSATPVCTPPAAPAGLTATAGDLLVILRWNTSSGATSYNVKRSLVNGGPYTLLSGGLTGTNCTDSVVTNGTTYYYVVSAVNAGCESTNSIQASATPTNHPPVLAAISNQTILAGRTLLITNSATDADVPQQALSFSLLSAPANAVINASSGVFSWRPTMAQSPSTQTVAVVVSDNGTPILSATQSFTATVIQPVEPALNAGSITDGRFGFWINGDSGPDYTILASTNLTSWNPIFTNNSPSLPCYWVDTNSAAYPARYYRTVLGP